MPILTTRGKHPHGEPAAGQLARPAWLWALGALPLVVVGLVAGLALSGAAAPRELIDPGPLVRWGLPLVTSLARVAATVTIGALMLCAVVLPRTTPPPTGEDHARREWAGPAVGSERPADRRRPRTPRGDAWRTSPWPAP